MSSRNDKAAALLPTIPFSLGMVKYELPAVQSLRATGKYGATIVSGFEWDMPTHDHLGIAIFDKGAKLASSTNPSTRVLKRFTSADWKIDASGRATMTFVTPALKGQYFRRRGTNLGTDAAGLMRAGEPLADDKVTAADATQRFNDIHDRNCKTLWFYSNPVFLSVR